MVPIKPKTRTVAGALQNTRGEQADYRASQRETKLRPRPRGIRAQGSSADWHFRRDSDHLWVGELGREYDRNTPVGKRLLNVFEQNVLQDQGFAYNPNTGDAKLDDEAKHYIDELLGDPTRIDLQGEHDFNDLSRMVFRDHLAAGDIFGVFNQEGPIEVRESHLCRQPFNRGVRHKNNVLGVELNEKRQRVGYWFTNEPINPLDSYRVKQSDLHFVGAWDVSGDWHTRNVLHVRDPKRVTQTRGVSVFAPVFDYLGMFEDSQFQQLVKQQLSNMLLLIRQRGQHFNPQYLSKRLQTGVDSETPAGVNRLLEELYPGAELHGFPDEQITPWAPNIPNAEWFNHMRLVLRIIGIAWGLPYVLLMLDTADTNFHGYRGAIVEARDLFRNLQRSFARRWHTPVVKNYLHRWADEDKAIARFRDRSLREARLRRSPRSQRFNLFRHTWTLPGWASVDDLKDATADLMRLANSQTSHRRIAQSQDAEWADLSREIIEDKSLHFRGGIDAALELIDYTVTEAKRKGITIDPGTLTLGDIERMANRLAPLPLPERVQLSMSLQEPQSRSSQAGDADDA